MSAPWDAALEAYKRAHPGRVEAVDAAMAAGPSEDSELEGPPAADTPPASEQAELLGECVSCHGEGRLWSKRVGEYVPCPRCGSLSDPDKDEIGKFQRPGDAAETQRLAAVAVYPQSGTSRRKVLDAIGQAGERGLTDEQAQAVTGLNPSTQRPRRVELVEGGWVKDSGRRAKTASGVDAVIWVLTARGREVWR